MSIQPIPLDNFGQLPRRTVRRKANDFKVFSS
jgi:hypothetical protein